MAFGMKDPGYYGYTGAFKDPKQQTITPLRTYDIKSNIAGRNVQIEQDGTVIYSTHSHSTFAKEPIVSMYRGEDDKAPPVAGAKLKTNGMFDAYLGDPTAKTDLGRQECTVSLTSSTTTSQHSFCPPGELKKYAWRETQQREISIAGTDVQTAGLDRKLISLDSDGEEDELFAVLIHSPKAHMRHQSQIFWAENISGDLELWALTAAVAWIEKKRKGKNKYGFGAMVGAGAVM